MTEIPLWERLAFEVAIILCLGWFAVYVFRRHALRAEPLVVRLAAATGLVVVLLATVVAFVQDVMELAT